MFKQYSLRHPQQRIAALYFLVAASWILFSDGVLYFVGVDELLIPSISIIKGIIFVCVTSLILFISLQREFSQRFQLEAALQAKVEEATRSKTEVLQSEKRFKKAVEEAPHPIMLFADDGQVLTVSQAWFDITGYTREQLLTLDDWTERAYGSDKEHILEGIDRLFDLTTRVDEGEFTVRCADGTERIWLFSSTPLDHLPDNRRLVMSIATDVTELKAAESRLKGLVNQLELAVDTAQLGIWQLDVETGQLTWNKQLHTIYGITPEEFTENVDGWRSLVHPEDSEHADQRFAEIFSSGKVFDVKFRIIRKDGELRHIDASGCAEYDEHGDVVRVIGINRDVTNQKQGELFALEHERLKASFNKEKERNALVQRIVSALSHDLRTALTVISTSKDMLAMYYHRMTPEKRREKLDAISRHVQFALELLDDTVNMARGNQDDASFKPTSTNIAALCQVSVGEVQTPKENKGRVKFVNRDGTETAIVDEVLVSRILVNLLSNALKYSPDDSEIRLELESSTEQITIRVIDQGIGISEQDLDYIFDPFFRTKDVGQIKGTGLGLSIVKDCVDRHQGTVHVESTQGVGTTFTVKLPVAEATASLPVAQ